MNPTQILFSTALAILTWAVCSADGLAGPVSVESNAVQIIPNGDILVSGYMSGGNPLDFPLWRFKPDGTLDKQFGKNGVVSDLFRDCRFGDSASLQTDSQGRIVVAGRCTNTKTRALELALVRFMPDGLLDMTFGEKGAVSSGPMSPLGTSGPYQSDWPHAFLLDSKGRFVLVGETYDRISREHDLVVWRYEVNGKPDASFGTNGVVLYRHSSLKKGVAGLALKFDARERLVVVGNTIDANNEMLLLRYNSDGTPDSTFGNKGLVIASTINPSFPSLNRLSGNSLQIDSQGHILVVGSAAFDDLGDSELAVWRYNSDGTPDGSFANNGLFTSGPVGADGATDSNENDRGTSVEVDSQGKILVAGATGGGMAFWRLDPNGKLDKSFSGRGFVVDIPTAASATSLRIDAQGKFVVSGFSYIAVHGNVIRNSQVGVLWRYNSDGSPDLTFGKSGLVTWP